MLKLKYQFVIRKIGEDHYAVAIPNSNEQMHRNEMLKLNDSGALIMKFLIEGKYTTEKEIEDELVAYYDIDSSIAHQATVFMIQELKKHGMLEE